MNKRTPVFFSLIAAGLLLVAGWVQFGEPVRTTFQPESTLKLDGTSTVHDWTCDATSLSGYADTDIADGFEILRAQVTVPIEALDCGHKAMNGRLAKTMSADDYPNVVYNMTDAEIMANPSPGEYKVQASGMLSMAGVEKPMALLVDAKRLDDGRFQFSGNIPIKMTDFGMKPVTFLAIKTGDEVTVSFNVISAE
jgi:polyisoprenoid-binding protein YceI